MQGCFESFWLNQNCDDSTFWAQWMYIVFQVLVRPCPEAAGLWHLLSIWGILRVAQLQQSLRAKPLVGGAFGCLWSSRRAHLGREELVWVAIVCICSTGVEPGATLPALCVFVDRILLIWSGWPKIYNTPALDTRALGL